MEFAVIQVIAENNFEVNIMIGKEPAPCPCQIIGLNMEYKVHRFVVNCQ